MDSFFAAVEILAYPALQGRPVVVGGIGPRGVVASASYAARTYGVRSAMPVGEARRLCPGLIVVAPRHDVYARTSEKLMGVCRQVTPIVEPVSLDEAYLDVKGAHQLFGTSEQIGWLLRNRVRDELDLTCAIGIGRTKLIAKLASKAAKPHPRPDAVDDGEGIVVVRPDEEIAFLHAHRVRAIPGIGPKTAERLKRAGVSTVRDLSLLGRDQLISMFGSAHGGSLFDLAWGRDDREVVSDRELRSIGNEVTFDVDDYERSSLASKARELAVVVASLCRERGVEARTVSIKVRFSDFETIVRSRTEQRPLGDANEIAAVTTNLLQSIDVDRGVRLIGVSVSNLVARAPHAVQLGLFAAPKDEPESHGEGTGRGREGAAELAADEIRKKFGQRAITSVAAAERRTSRERGRGGDRS